MCVRVTHTHALNQQFFCVVMCLDVIFGVGQLKLKLYRDENGELKGDGRCCYLKVGGRGGEVLLPQGGWEGRGGAATSRWEGLDWLSSPSSHPQRESVDLAIQLLNDSDYRGYRVYVELVSHTTPVDAYTSQSICRSTSQNTERRNSDI